MKVYTKTGDDGTTGIGKGRILKSAGLIEAVGAIDTATADIAAAAACLDKHIQRSDKETQIDALKFVYNKLSVASYPDTNILSCMMCIGANIHGSGIEPDNLSVGLLEASIDEMTNKIPPLKNFIIPRTEPATALFRARCSVREAERRLVALEHPWRSGIAILDLVLTWTGFLAPPVCFYTEIRYLNRLSDYLFTAARYADHTLGQESHIWTRPPTRFTSSTGVPQWASRFGW